MISMNRAMGITFVLMGIFFFITALSMILITSSVSAVAASLTAQGVSAGQLNSVTVFGWVFSAVTLLSGIFCIISAIMHFRVKK